MWSWLDSNVSSGVLRGHGAIWFWFVDERLNKLLHLLGQNWREMGRATGCPAPLPAMIWSQIWEHHGLVVVCLELFWELVTLRATVVALLVALVHSRVHGCGFQGAGCTRDIVGMVPVCFGVGSCWLAKSHSEVWKMPGNGLGRSNSTLFLRSPSQCSKRLCYPSRICGGSSLPWLASSMPVRRV